MTLLSYLPLLLLAILGAIAIWARIGFLMWRDARVRRAQHAEEMCRHVDREPGATSLSLFRENAKDVVAALERMGRTVVVTPDGEQLVRVEVGARGSGGGK